jgi:hypothetical protein
MDLLRSPRSVLLAAVLSAVPHAGCTRVAHVSPSQLPALSRHGPERPPVVIRTVDGDPVEIHGKFKVVRMFATDTDDASEREIVLKPPFLAGRYGSRLLYQRPDEHVRTVEIGSVTRVEIAQKDGGRTAIVLGVIGGAVLAGAVLSYVVARHSENKGAYITLFELAVPPMLLGGLAAAFVLPITRNY